jgi:ribosomal protein L19
LPFFDYRAGSKNRKRKERKLRAAKELEEKRKLKPIPPQPKIEPIDFKTHDFGGGFEVSESVMPETNPETGEPVVFEGPRNEEMSDVEQYQEQSYRQFPKLKRELPDIRDPKVLDFHSGSMLGDISGDQKVFVEFYEYVGIRSPVKVAHPRPSLEDVVVNRPGKPPRRQPSPRSWMRLINEHMVSEWKKDLPFRTDWKTGDEIEIDYKRSVRDPDAGVETWRGLVIGRRNRHYSTTIIFRQVLDGLTFERTIPVYSPWIADMRHIQSHPVTKNKLYYLRKLPNRTVP